MNIIIKIKMIVIKTRYFHNKIKILHTIYKIKIKNKLMIK
jgi:hypothetical protein